LHYRIKTISTSRALPAIMLLSCYGFTARLFMSPDTFYIRSVNEINSQHSKCSPLSQAIRVVTIKSFNCFICRKLSNVGGPQWCRITQRHRAK